MNGAHRDISRTAPATIAIRPIRVAGGSASRRSQQSLCPAIGPSNEAVSPLPVEADRFSEEPAVQDQVEQATALDRRPASYGTWEHAESCFARYRSYRPEDNTYQPYGGGPRSQCQ